MTLIEAAKQAREAFEWNFNTDLDNIPACERWAKMLKENIAALNQAIAKAEQQEPVAWRTFDGEGGYDYRDYDMNENYRDEYIKRNGTKYASWVEPLYEAPPKREWQGLTDEEILQTLDLVAYDTQAFDFAYRIEAKLKEKNT